MEGMSTFNFWCYKVLPLVYDDSLSYYEVLCKVVKYINDLIAEDKVITEEIDSLKNELSSVEAWIEAFDTEVAERIIREALDNMTGILLTSTITENDDAATIINTAITNGCKNIIVDSDTILTAPIYLTSGMTVKGMGGTISCVNSGAGIRAWGSRGTLLATASNVTEPNQSITVNDGTRFEVGKRYVIIGTENLINRNDQYSLGVGTSGAQTVYGGFEFVVTEISENTIYMDRRVPHYIGSAEIYTCADIENVIIEDLKIEGLDHLLYVRFGNNVIFNNCDVKCTGNYPVYMIYGYECNITNCSVQELVHESYYHNAIVLSSCAECTVDNNIVSGGYQGIDITYGDLYSFYNVISNNTVNHSEAGSFTTHPAAFKNIIIGNIFTGKLQIRCYGNQILNNTIADHLYISGNRVDNTVIKGNTFTATVPLQLTYTGDTESASYVDKVFFDSNVCTKCTKVVDGRNVGKTLALYITNNIIVGNGSTAYLISAEENYPAEYYQLYIIGNTLLGYQNLKIFGAASSVITCIRTKIENNNIYKTGTNTTIMFNVGTGNITGKVSGNDVNFDDAISTLQSPKFGADYPAYPLKGETFLKNDGTFAVFDGTNWRVISTT